MAYIYRPLSLPKGRAAPWSLSQSKGRGFFPVPEPAEGPRCDLRGTGEFICLSIYLNDGTEIDGRISFDNFDLVFERLPIALQDPDNVDFYLPGFYLFGKDE